MYTDVKKETTLKKDNNLFFFHAKIRTDQSSKVNKAKRIPEMKKKTKKERKWNEVRGKIEEQS